MHTNTDPQLAVTLSPELYRHLRAEARRLNIPMEWLVASLVVDTVDEKQAEPAVA